MKILILLLVLLGGCASSTVKQPEHLKGEQSYKVDRFGNILYHKDSEIKIGNRSYQVDKFGNISYHKGYKLVKEK